MLEDIQNLIAGEPDGSFLFKRNLAKEYLQVMALSFIYADPLYKSLIFYGGSALRHCRGLDRLSEDLDFVDEGRGVDLDKLGADLKAFFKTRLNVQIISKRQKFRLVLRFPIMRELKLAAAGESNNLYLKAEVFRDISFCAKYSMEIVPIFKHGESFLVRTFDLPTMMATKIRAVLGRKWEKTDKAGRTLAVVKGRDYFDLMWYLQKGVSPNMACLENFKGPEELFEELVKIVEKVDVRSIQYDLEGLVRDRQLARNLAANIREILLNQLKNVNPQTRALPPNQEPPATRSI
ncbi:MAG: nucleotidyl transferase AbiEii/AbiGii toxin family protein [Elusimicrobia bacterium]|nr:nucleotidyl transferase AbiEii/AbiGii toxin family protein [Elusimicrobiota bacterium]